jgi:hypothetical protein
MCASFLAAACGTTRVEPLGDGSAASRPKCTDTPSLLVDYIDQVPDSSRGLVQMPEVAVNSTDLFYFFTTGRGDTKIGRLVRVPLRGGTPVPLALVPGLMNTQLQALVATPTGVIYAEGPHGDAGAGEILVVPSHGGEPRTLAPTAGRANGLVADDENLYFFDREATKAVPLAGGDVRVVTDKLGAPGVVGDMLVLANGDGTISSVPKQGGPLKLLASGPWQPLAPIDCGGSACWLIIGVLGQLMRVGLDGGTPEVLIEGLSGMTHLVFNGKNFFVTLGGGGLGIYRIPAEGNEATAIVTGTGISGLALDDECLYWSSFYGIFSLALRAADVAGPAH